MNPNNFKFIDLFAGIGGIRIPFVELGGKCVFTSEIDPYCQEMYEANFGEKPTGDICAVNAKDIPNHDILLGGFPCQAFSIIGDRKGFDDTRGTLFFEIERILREKKPHAFLLENVRQLTTHDEGRTFSVILSRLKSLGYFVHHKVLNALHYGVPQKRERIMMVGFVKNYKFVFPEPVKKGQKLEDILENEKHIDDKHYASKEIVKERKQMVKGKKVVYPSVWHQNKGGNIGVHPFSCALRAGASYNYLLVNGVRRFTPRELLRLQGFPDSFKMVVPDSQIRKQTGNSVAVPCIRAVAKEMKKAILGGVIDDKLKLNGSNQLSFRFEEESPKEMISKDGIALNLNNSLSYLSAALKELKMKNDELKARLEILEKDLTVNK